MVDQRNPTNLERLEQLEARARELSDRVLKLETVINAFAAILNGGGNDAANDRELDHQYGDPDVKVSPRDWSGPLMKGRKFSQCEPDFLDLLAETFDFFERKNRESGEKTSSGKLKADFDKRSARLARGWARRLRSGWTAPERPKPAFANGNGPTNGTNPFANGSSGFGASRATPPAQQEQPPPLSASSEPSTESEDDSFDFGANVKDDQEEDIPPLA